MSWKQTAQRSLYDVDALLVEHKSLSKLDGDMRGQVYADRAYANKDNDRKLGKANNKILHSAYRNQRLTAQQKAQNKNYSSVRYIDD